MHFFSKLRNVKKRTLAWPLREIRKRLAIPGFAEALIAIAVTLADIALFFIRDNPNLGALVLIGALMTVLISIVRRYPLLVAILGPITFFFGNFLLNAEAGLQIFYALILIEVLRLVSSRLPIKISAVVMWLIANFDTMSMSFTRDVFALFVTVSLFALFYAVGSLRHRSYIAALTSRLEARKALHDQRLELASFLHDSIAKSFTRVTMRAQTMAIDVENDDPDLADELNALADLSRESLLQLRQLLSLLKEDDDEVDKQESLPAALGQERSIPNLTQVLDQAKQELTQAGFEVELNTSLADEPALSTISEILAPSISEICTNIEKYAEPRSLVAMDASGSKADGYTIKLKNLIAAKADYRLDIDLISSGVGLPAIQRRAAEVGGSVRTEKAYNIWITTLKLPGKPNED